MTDAGQVPAHDKDELLNSVPADGSTISNPALREKLGWGSENDNRRYYGARNALVEVGFLLLGRGRGGTVSRAATPSAYHHGPAGTAPGVIASGTTVSPVVRGDPRYLHERDLYAPMKAAITEDWARDHDVDPARTEVEITAAQGKKHTGGMWSRPDIASVEVRSFPYVPGKVLEVVTFEVKPVDEIDVRAVYEALAQRRAATRSYVLLHVPDHDAQLLEAVIENILDAARTHGIGVITAPDPKRYDTWTEHQPASRVPTDPAELNRFVGQQLPPDARTRINDRVR